VPPSAGRPNRRLPSLFRRSMPLVIMPGFGAKVEVKTGWRRPLGPYCRFLGETPAAPLTRFPRRIDTLQNIIEMAADGLVALARERAQSFWIAHRKPRSPGFDTDSIFRASRMPALRSQNETHLRPVLPRGYSAIPGFSLQDLCVGVSWARWTVWELGADMRKVARRFRSTGFLLEHRPGNAGSRVRLPAFPPNTPQSECPVLRDRPARPRAAGHIGGVDRWRVKPPPVSCLAQLNG
jgi:hypothetical protein